MIKLNFFINKSNKTTKNTKHEQTKVNYIKNNRSKPTITTINQRKNQQKSNKQNY